MRMAYVPNDDVARGSMHWNTLHRWGQLRRSSRNMRLPHRGAQTDTLLRRRVWRLFGAGRILPAFDKPMTYLGIHTGVPKRTNAGWSIYCACGWKTNEPTEYPDGAVLQHERHLEWILMKSKMRKYSPKAI